MANGIHHREFLGYHLSFVQGVFFQFVPKLTKYLHGYVVDENPTLKSFFVLHMTHRGVERIFEVGKKLLNFASPFVFFKYFLGRQGKYCATRQGGPWQALSEDIFRDFILRVLRRFCADSLGVPVLSMRRLKKDIISRLALRTRCFADERKQVSSGMKNTSWRHPCRGVCCNPQRRCFSLAG